MNWETVVQFHGHVCPGLALGYRVSEPVMSIFGERPSDEELVAIVENNSCAVDAIQVMTGCTFGKGNLHFQDHGKQVYTFIQRRSLEALRIAVKWVSTSETEAEQNAWKKYSDGDRSEEVQNLVRERKAKKIQEILAASLEDLFEIKKITIEPPREARIYPSLVCSSCGEKVMETRIRFKDHKIHCIPCAEMKK